jgi:hypothetical protein
MDGRRTAEAADLGRVINTLPMGRERTKRAFAIVIEGKSFGCPPHLLFICAAVLLELLLPDCCSQFSYLYRRLAGRRREDSRSVRCHAVLCRVLLSNDQASEGRCGAVPRHGMLGALRTRRHRDEKRRRVHTTTTANNNNNNTKTTQASSENGIDSLQNVHDPDGGVAVEKTME